MTDLIITQKLNNIRIANEGKHHSKDGILKLLSDIPYKQRLFGLLVKDKFILRHIEGYTFSNTPIHNVRITNLLAPIRKYYRDYYYSGKKEVDTTREQEAIQYLKSLGYLIYKQA